MAKLMEIIKGLISCSFYGKLTIKFEHGKIVHLVKEESLKV